MISRSVFVTGEAVKDLCLSFEKGLIVNSFENDLYYNVRRLKNIKAK